MNLIQSVSENATFEQIVARMMSGQKAGKRKVSAREEILRMVEHAPDSASRDQIIDRVLFGHKLDQGLAQLDAGEGIPHAAARSRLMGEGV